MVFYSRYAKLSNHHPSDFTIDEQTFHSMEHFLAVRRAEFSGNEEMISKAKNVSDPVQAKRILNELKGNYQQESEQQIEETALEGLRAKFGQNRELRNYLCGTKHLVLGEASVNPVWGIGMDIADPEVLNESKWLPSGNLLGRALMKVRSELLAKGGQPPQ